ncbi:MAG: hypothetical protein HYT86_05545 [candidate division NC10 bacterium]|nr:hypothetical protein [candidate division NC10 bacterium]
MEALVERVGAGVGKGVILDITFTNKTTRPLSRASVTLRFYDEGNRLVRETTVQMIALDAAVAKTKYTAAPAPPRPPAPLGNPPVVPPIGPAPMGPPSATGALGGIRRHPDAGSHNVSRLY